METRGMNGTWVITGIQWHLEISFCFLVQWGPGIILLPLGSLLFFDHYDGLYPSQLEAHTDPSSLKLLLSAVL